MDFDTESWGVEQSALDLDTSLFGPLNGITYSKKNTKKQKLKTEQQVLDPSSPTKKSKKETPIDKLSQSESRFGLDDEGNLLKKRKKHLKDKQRKLKKKKQNLNKQSSETYKETSISNNQNENSDKKFEEEKSYRKNSDSVKQNEKIKLKHVQGGKDYSVSSEKMKKSEAQISMGKSKNKKLLVNAEKVKNNKNKKTESSDRSEKVQNKHELTVDNKKVKHHVKNHIEDHSQDGEIQSETVNGKKKKKKKKRRKKTSLDTENIVKKAEKELIQDSSNLSKQVTNANLKGEKLNVTRDNFSNIKTPETKHAKKRKNSFNINELKSVLSKEKLVKSAADSDFSKHEHCSSKKSKKFRNEKEHQDKLNEKKTEATMKDKPESPVKEKKVVPSLKDRLTEQLKSARFRYLNEKLYTQSSQSAYEMFQNDREAFQVYHDGFQGQVSKWPINPVDVIIRYIKTQPKHLVVADFGCGDAKISQSVPNKVHSFDLVAVNKHVTVCDMSKVPLKDGSIDIAVFCLSLMGTNLTDYLKEASRVLKKGGTMKIAEVNSRFQTTSIARFIVGVEQYGFQFIQKDTTNKMFVLMDFKKSKTPKSSLPEVQLDPCLYKKR